MPATNSEKELNAFFERLKKLTSPMSALSKHTHTAIQSITPAVKYLNQINDITKQLYKAFSPDLLRVTKIGLEVARNFPSDEI